jgi:hypothetical protein
MYCEPYELRADSIPAVIGKLLTDPPLQMKPRSRNTGGWKMALLNYFVSKAPNVLCRRCLQLVDILFATCLPRAQFCKVITRLLISISSGFDPRVYLADTALKACRVEVSSADGPRTPDQGRTVFLPYNKTLKV